MVCNIVCLTGSRTFWETHLWLPVRNFLDWVNWSTKDSRQCSGLYTKKAGNGLSISLHLFWLLAMAAASHAASHSHWHPFPRVLHCNLKLWAKGNLPFLQSQRRWLTSYLLSIFICRSQGGTLFFLMFCENCLGTPHTFYDPLSLSIFFRFFDITTSVCFSTPCLFMTE